MYEGFRDGESAHADAWDRVVRRICYGELIWPPGSRCCYSDLGFFLLGEIVRRVDPKRRPYMQYVREEIFAPLGLHDMWVGMPSAEHERYAREDRISHLTTTGMSPACDSGMAKPAELMACDPSGNLRAPAAQCVELFVMLLNGGVGADGTRLLQPSTVRMLTERWPRRTGMFDELQGVQVDWSLGLFVGGESLLGRTPSRDSYGHGGSQSSVGYCDPAHQLAVAYVANNRPGPVAHVERLQRLVAALYEDLGLCLQAGYAQGR